MSIEAELKKWASSPAGKKRIAEVKAQKLKAGQKFGQGSSGVSVEQAKMYAEELRQAIYDNIPVSLKAGSERPIELSDIIISKPMVLPNGSISIDLSFAPDAIHRDSLDPERYENGVDNIVSLFSRGYTAHGDVWGMWHGHEQWNLLQRRADPFMKRAVAEFLVNRGDVAQVTLPEDYQA